MGCQGADQRMMVGAGRFYDQVPIAVGEAPRQPTQEPLYTCLGVRERPPLGPRDVSYFQRFFRHIHTHVFHTNPPPLIWTVPLLARCGATLSMRAWWPKMPSALDKGRRETYLSHGLLCPKHDNGLTSVPGSQYTKMLCCWFRENQTVQPIERSMSSGRGVIVTSSSTQPPTESCHGRTGAI